MMTGLLDAGWLVPLLLEVITRPLPELLRTTVGAVISGRLKAAASMPVPGSAAGAVIVPRQAPGPGPCAPGEGCCWDDAPARTPPAWAELEQQHDQIRRGTDLTPVCEADGGLCPTLAVVGETLCPLHLGWPLCPGIDGYTCTIRTRNGDHCATCRDQARYARLDAVLPVTATDDGTCPRPHRPLRPCSPPRRPALRPVPGRLPARPRPGPAGVGSDPGRRSWRRPRQKRPQRRPQRRSEQRSSAPGPSLQPGRRLALSGPYSRSPAPGLGLARRAKFRRRRP